MKNFLKVATVTSGANTGIQTIIKIDSIQRVQITATTCVINYNLSGTNKTVTLTFNGTAEEKLANAQKTLKYLEGILQGEDNSFALAPTVILDTDLVVKLGLVNTDNANLALTSTTLS